MNAEEVKLLAEKVFLVLAINCKVNVYQWFIVSYLLVTVNFRVTALQASASLQLYSAAEL